ncbi:hypothetical protein YPPY94_4656, partial [Yersinia pestis PY-94]
MRKVTAGYSPP